MCCPEPKDPQDAQVARQYLDDRKAWEKQARFWTETYAGEGAKAAKNNGEAGPLLPSASSSAPHTSGGSAGASAAGNARAAPSALPIGTPPQFIEGVKTIMEMGFSGEKALERGLLRRDVPALVYLSCGDTSLPPLVYRI